MGACFLRTNSELEHDRSRWCPAPRNRDRLPWPLPAASRPLRAIGFTLCGDKFPFFPPTLIGTQMSLRWGPLVIGVNQRRVFFPRPVMAEVILIDLPRERRTVRGGRRPWDTLKI